MEFVDLVDIDELRRLWESCTAFSGAASAILDLDGNILVATGWQEICTQFHRVHPETASRCRMSDTILASQLAKGERYNVYRCRNGLVDVAVPITIDGERVAHLFAGQFFLEAPEKEYFMRQAERFGFDEAAYLQALGRVPIYDDQQVRAMLDFFPAWLVSWGRWASRGSVSRMPTRNSVNTRSTWKTWYSSGRLPSPLPGKGRKRPIRPRASF